MHVIFNQDIDFCDFEIFQSFAKMYASYTPYAGDWLENIIIFPFSIVKLGLLLFPTKFDTPWTIPES